ncbi:MAG: hypothetical protein R3A52_05840 [Polyangiales bacterium]
MIGAGRDRAPWVLALEGRGPALAAITALHAMVSFAFAAVALGPVRATLARHPAGAGALWLDDGRYLLDLARLHGGVVDVAAVSLLALVLAYALAWSLFGGVLPALAMGARPPRLYRAAAESLRRAPTLLALAAVAGGAFAVSAALAWQSWRWALDPANATVSGASAHARALAAMLPAALLAVLASVWHDVARTLAVAQGMTAHRAAIKAGSAMARRPLQTAAAAALFAAGGAAGPALATALGLLVGRNETTTAVVFLCAARLAALAAKTHARMRWFRWVSLRAG